MKLAVGISQCIAGRAGSGSPAAPPAIAGNGGVTPSTGIVAGGLSVAIAGTDFVSGCTATIGGVAAAVVFVSRRALTLTTPLGVAGTRDVVITNPDGKTSGTSGVGKFVYTASPLAIGVIVPSSGLQIGGTPVALAGTGFTGKTSAELGGVALTSFVVVSDIAITGVSGAHAAGAVNITVNGAGATPGYTYV